MWLCQNNSKKSYTEKKTKHTASSYSLFTNYSFGTTKNKLDCYREKDCMERFCKDWREHVIKIIDCEKKKKIIPLTNKENKSFKKYFTISVPIKKELDNSKTITYKLNFVDSFRFMSTSLSSLVDNSSDRFNCNKSIDCKSSLDYMRTRDDK